MMSAAAGAAVVASVIWVGSEEVGRRADPASSPTWEIETSLVQLEDQPYALYDDGDTLWVSGGRGSVMEVRDQPVAKHPHPTGPLGITVVDGDVWTTSATEHQHSEGQVIVLDRRSGNVVRTVRLPGDSPYGIDHARGGVFVALYDGELLKIDRRGEGTERVPLGDGLTQVLATNEAVWVSQPGVGVVWRVTFEGAQSLAEDISLNRRSARSCPQGSDAGEQFVFVADPCAGKVWRLDRHTGTVTGVVSEAGRRPVDVAVDDGLIYVVSMRDDRVTVLAEATLDEIAEAQAGEGAISVAAGSGVAWVANADDSTLTRIEVRRPNR